MGFVNRSLIQSVNNSNKEESREEDQRVLQVLIVILSKHAPFKAVTVVAMRFMITVMRFRHEPVRWREGKRQSVERFRRVTVYNCPNVEAGFGSCNDFLVT